MQRVAKFSLRSQAGSPCGQIAKLVSVFLGQARKNDSEHHKRSCSNQRGKQTLHGMEAALTIIVSDRMTVLLTFIENFAESSIRLALGHAGTIQIISRHKNSEDTAENTAPHTVKSQHDTGNKIDNRHGKHHKHALESKFPCVFAIPRAFDNRLLDDLYGLCLFVFALHCFSLSLCQRFSKILGTRCVTASSTS